MCRTLFRLGFVMSAVLAVASTSGQQAAPPSSQRQPAQPQPAQPQPAQRQAAEPKPSDTLPSADEQQVRQGVLAFVERYNAHKADEVAALFAPDARMILRDGTQVDGRDNIKQSFADAFDETPQTAISVVVDSIRFLTPDVAVEEGATSLFPDGETLTSRGRYTVLHLKRNGKWLMQSVRADEEESLSAYGALQPLEWLVGDWIDEGREEVVEAKFRWDENKSFLVEDFRVVQEGTVVLQGTQRIGWDPQAKQIRSWTFDNAGGFGSAVWNAVDDDWICNATAVTPEGESASATRTLTRAAPDRVIWRSTERLLAGQQLPELAVTMVRKPPQPK